MRRATPVSDASSVDFLTPPGTIPTYNCATTRDAIDQETQMSTTAPDMAPRTGENREPVHDFDFYFGSWRVHHTQLVERLAGSTAWREFEGTSIAQPTMAGAGNIDDNVLEHPDGTYRAVSIRAFDPEKRQWAIWWLDGRHPDRIEPPVYGRFEDGVGTFIGEDTFNGIPILVRFLWSDITQTTCRWEQAFSTDRGGTWEVNWIMESTRID
jgi:hypothetical protein